MATSCLSSYTRCVTRRALGFLLPPWIHDWCRAVLISAYAYNIPNHCQFKHVRQIPSDYLFEQLCTGSQINLLATQSFFAVIYDSNTPKHKWWSTFVFICLCGCGMDRNVLEADDLSLSPNYCQDVVWIIHSTYFVFSLRSNYFSLYDLPYTKNILFLLSSYQLNRGSCYWEKTVMLPLSSWYNQTIKNLKNFIYVFYYLRYQYIIF